MTEVETFRNGVVVSEIVEFKKDNYSLILSLCNRIRREESENRSVLEYVLIEMCDAIGATAGSIWSRQLEGKKRLCTYGSAKSSDSLMRRFERRSNSIIISNNPLSDPRFKRRKISKPKKPRATSVPVLKTVRSRKRSILPIPDIALFSFMIIPFGDQGNAGQLVFESSRVDLAIQDIEKISILFTLVEKALRTDFSEDGIVSTIKAVNRERESNGIKDVFLATVSHELRTPLNGIVGMITMLKDAGPLNSKQEEYLTILMECSHQLMNMMNNLLDFSKMVSNRLVLLKGPTSISKSVNDAVLMVQGKAKSKSLKLNVSVPANIPILIGDGQRLTQILSNLLSNAVKFTERGHVSLKVRADKMPQGEDDPARELPYVKKWKIVFEVEDTGIGIPLTEQTKIFDVFHQSYNIDLLMARNGTGLGLSITKELVKMMNGKIVVNSEGVQGKGSRFTFYITTEEEIRMTDLASNHTEIIKGSRILVVDDRPEYRLQLADMLFKWGCIPTVVSSGEEALQYVRHNIEFDTIIVDICMNYMSGVELAQELRTNAKTSRIPLIALSSIDLQSGTELFDIYMNKPIDQNYLFPSLLECLIKNKAIKEGTQVVTFPKGKAVIKKLKRRDLKILIAEDDHNNAFTIREMLVYLGFSPENIKTVENGEKCVTEVKTAKYDVILMDILMPKMNGIEATRHIRQMNPRPYIVAVSAAVQNSDKERCQQVGVDTYLTKPVLKEKLNAALIALVSD